MKEKIQWKVILTAKLIRKYCKKYGKSYKLAKTQFSRLSARQQFQMIVDLKLMTEETPVSVSNIRKPTLFKGVAPSSLPSPTEKKTNPTPVKRVTHGGVGE